MLVYMAAQQKDYAQIDQMVKSFQTAMQKVRYARVPVVAAPFGYTFGGACELSMGGGQLPSFCGAHYMGLVEVGVGLVPAGGGCLRLLERYCQPIGDVAGADLLPAVGQASLQVATAQVSTGAEDARRLRYLESHDGISLNRDRLLYEAKQRALGLARAGYRPPLPRRIKVAGLDAARTIGMRIWGLVEGKMASEHDAIIANKLANILCGGSYGAGEWVEPSVILDLEREAFTSLSAMKNTQDRIQSLLTTNKPLRN